MTKKFLLSGCAGDIAISISKVLKSIYPDCSLVGMDINPLPFCSLFFDLVLKSPAAKDSSFIKHLNKTISDNCIDIFIPTPEVELDVLAGIDLTKEISIKCLLPNSKAINIGKDKLETAQFLSSLELPAPWTFKASKKPKSLPCIFKSRFGSGSKQVQVIADEKLVPILSARGDDYIWQELVLPEDMEFTCGLFRNSKGETRSIVIKRRLSGGLTGYGEVVKNEQIDQLLDRIAEELNLIGSINVQLRLSGDTPIIFEINPRFSSTVYFRHLLGFEDLKWSLEDLLGKNISNYVLVPCGKKIYRASEEIIFE